MLKRKILLITIKLIPSILAFICLVGTILERIGISLITLSFLGFLSFIPALFILLASFALDFCIWHRLPIYYILVSNIINYIVLFIPTLISTSFLLCTHFIVIGILILIGAYVKNKHNGKNRNSENGSTAINK